MRANSNSSLPKHVITEESIRLPIDTPDYKPGQKGEENKFVFPPPPKIEKAKKLENEKFESAMSMQHINKKHSEIQNDLKAMDSVPVISK